MKFNSVLPPILSLQGGRAPYFDLPKILFLEHNATTRQQTMTEKGIITFKHNFPLTFSPFFAKLLATNCCALTWRNIPSYDFAFADVSAEET